MDTAKHMRISQRMEHIIMDLAFSFRMRFLL